MDYGFWMMNFGLWRSRCGGLILLRKSVEGLLSLLGFMVQGEFEVQRRFVAKSRV